MTDSPNSPSPSVEVTQADRDAAADYFRATFRRSVFINETLRGKRDGYLVQAFARHRLAALSTLPEPPGDEKLARIWNSTLKVFEDPPQPSTDGNYKVDSRFLDG